MGIGDSKQFLPLLGKPVIAYTLCAFEQAQDIVEIILVCREEDRPRMIRIAEKTGISKLKQVIPGGKSRGDSVRAGVDAVSPHSAYIAIHDGARPLILPETIQRVLTDAYRHQAATLAVPVKDTIKRSDENGMVIETPRRECLWSVQTPQVFQKELYCRAAKLAAENSEDYTDDCQLIEAMGIGVHLCMGEYTNLKITTPDDIAAAEAVLKARRSLK